MKPRTKKVLEIEERIGKPLEDYLFEQRSAGIAVSQIARRLGVRTMTLYQWAEWYNWDEKFKVRKSPNRDLEKELGESLEVYLRRECTVNNKSLTDVADVLRVRGKTLCDWLIKFDIVVADQTEIDSLRGKVRPSKEVLERLYVTKRRSGTVIGKIYSVAHTTVMGWLEEEGIQRRSVSEAKLPSEYVPPSKEDLECMYITEKKSLREIGDIFGVSDGTINKLAKKYGIPLRNENTYEKKDFRKSLADKLLAATGKRPEQLRTSDFSQTKENGRRVYTTLLRWYRREHDCKHKEAVSYLVGDLYGTTPQDNKTEIEFFLSEYAAEAW